MTLWTQELDQVWLNEMIHQASILGKRSNSGFKKEAWVESLKKFNARPNCSFTMAQLKSHNATLREQYSIILSMANVCNGLGVRLLSRCLPGHHMGRLPRNQAEVVPAVEEQAIPAVHLCDNLYKGTLATDG
ncbi:hypothetical protein AaE_015961 [Aphanomyces astaci]|uniref:Myb/SANT-like domain-containing protein n=1 Tax=Aphanomyces astaci TaxID=112090 RepID=A0A6A4YVG1_APHAT|nr:hypothetical protein AaE_015961 [Aphanomyces astaci]